MKYAHQCIDRRFETGRAYKKPAPPGAGLHSQIGLRPGPASHPGANGCCRCQSGYAARGRLGLNESGEGLAKLLDLGPCHGHAIALKRVALKKILVVILGRPVVAQRQNLGDDGPAKRIGLAHTVHHFLSDVALLWR